MTSCNLKQLGFIHLRIHSQYWMKNMHFEFIFTSKHIIVTNYSCICDFIWLYQHYSHTCDYNSHIYDYTFTTKIKHRTNLTIVIKVVDLNICCIIVVMIWVGMDKISSNENVHNAWSQVTRTFNLIMVCYICLWTIET
jgi:hypothetical protein